MLLLLAVSLLAQEPDCSTPEKTVRAWLKADEAKVEAPKAESERWKAIGTEALLASLAAKEKAARDALSWVTPAKESGVRTDEKDGAAMVERRMIHSFPSGEVKDGKLVMIDREVAERWTLAKVDGAWKIRGCITTCLTCEGSGLCIVCEGTGRLVTGACGSCSKRKGACGSCDRGTVATDFGPGFRAATTDEAETAPDLGTPRGAAAAYLAVVARLKSESSRRDLDACAARIERAKRFLHADVLAAMQASLSKLRDGAAGTWRDRKEVVDVVETGDEKATAVVSSAFVREWSESRRVRLLLKKAGDGWRVDAVTDPCISCDGGGKCTLCAGTGTMSMHTKCVACQGKNSAGCRACAGAGEQAVSVGCPGCKQGGKCGRCAGSGWGADR